LTKTSSVNNEGFEVSDIPTLKGNLAIGYQPMNHPFSGFLMIHYLGSFSRGGHEQMREDGYFTLDSSLKYKFSTKLSVLVSGRNLLDSNYHMLNAGQPYLQVPRRSVFLTLQGALK